MEAKATARYIGMSPRKVRQVVDLIRGKPVKTALSVLDFAPKLAAREVKKVLRSAAANAENNHDMGRTDLWVATAYVDPGPSQRRRREGAMGRGSIILKRSCHITVVVSDAER
jgi:large subunit ribosomal protein L22